MSMNFLLLSLFLCSPYSTKSWKRMSIAVTFSVSHIAGPEEPSKERDRKGQEYRWLTAEGPLSMGDLELFSDCLMEIIQGPTIWL